MAKTEANKPVKVKEAKDSSLKGTLVSVFILGAALLATWAGVYFLFLDRL